MTARACVVVLALVSALIGAAPAAAQEPALPPDVVARVGEDQVTTRDFRHWLRIGVRGAGPLDPPKYERCIASERKNVPKGRRTPSTRVLRARCEQRYEEAAARGITVAPSRVRRRLKSQRSKAFKNDRAYRRYLRDTGLTRADLLYRFRLEMLQQAVTKRVVASVPPVTSDDVTRYYTRHRAKYRGVTRSRARRAIRRRLTSSRQQAAISRFIEAFRARYKEQTVCAKDYTVAECGSVAG